MDGTVLIADDDRTIRTVLTQALTRAGCRVHATSSLTTLMRWVGEGMGDAVITDVVMPDGNGLEMLPKIHQDRPGLPVIVISAQNTIMTAIKAEEAAAFDYLPKPFDLPEIMKRTARALQTSTQTTRSPAAETERPEELPLVGRTPVMQALYRVVARVMNADLPVMISGESGSGKTLIAQAIHSLSDRRGLPMITVGPGDLDDTEAATRVMARARGGTVLLDEVGDFDTASQARIVRMMDQSNEDAPRYLATRAQGAGQGDTTGGLREDLYYRLTGAVIDVPPLRERMDDVDLLAVHFLKHAEQAGQPPKRISDDAMGLLRRYSWPGNVRQLENVVRRMGLTTLTPDISQADVTEALSAQPAFAAVQAGAGGGDSLSASVGAHIQRYFDMHGAILPPSGLYQRILREVEAPLIEIALDATGGNQAKCAQLLGINRNTLRKKITELDIRVTRRRKLM
ncbi:MAG: response regulator [Roseovarius sp.]